MKRLTPSLPTFNWLAIPHGSDNRTRKDSPSSMESTMINWSALSPPSSVPLPPLDWREELMATETAPPDPATTRALETSLRAFAEAAWSVIEPATPFVPGWHIDAICEHLEAVSRGQIRNLIINMPPRHMKSSLVAVLWPAWEWTTAPHMRWLFTSYAQSLSVRDSIKTRRLIQSPWYQARWGHRYQLTRDQNEKLRFENDRTGYRLATSIDGSNTGEGGDRIVADDPHNVREAESDTVRLSVIDAWDSAIANRANNPKTVARVVMMQRVHEEDLSGHLLARGDWEHLMLPAEFEPQRRCATVLGWSDPRQHENELLWPDRFGPKEMADLKRDLALPYRIAGQLQQRPAPAEGGVLKDWWWRYWCWEGQEDILPPVRVRTPEGEQLLRARQIPAGFDIELQSWDMAFKDTKHSAFVVGQVWGQEAADCYLRDQVREKMDFVATQDAVIETTRLWPRALLKLVEDKANGPAIIASLRSKIPGFDAVEPDGSKEARMMAVAPAIKSGNVYIPHPMIAPWVPGFLAECAVAPYGRYMDQVDTMSQALKRLLFGPSAAPVDRHGSIPIVSARALARGAKGVRRR
jgi:predicted phage terminase large subunit-like protein